MKTVFSNAELAHVWAHQGQEYGRNARESLHFSGPELFSYRTLIGMLHGGRAYLTDTTYSITTTSHMGDSRQAVSHMPQVYVPDLHNLLRDPEKWARENCDYALDLAGGATGKLAVKSLIQAWARTNKQWRDLVNIARRARADRSAAVRAARRREFDKIRAELAELTSSADADFAPRDALALTVREWNRARPYWRRGRMNWLDLQYEAEKLAEREMSATSRARGLRAKARRLIREGYAPARRYSDSFARRVNGAIREMDQIARRRARAFEAVARYARYAQYCDTMRAWRAAPRSWTLKDLDFSRLADLERKLRTARMGGARNAWRILEVREGIRRAYDAAEYYEYEAMRAAHHVEGMAAIDPDSLRYGATTPGGVMAAAHGAEWRLTRLETWPDGLIPCWIDPAIVARARAVWDKAAALARRARMAEKAQEAMRDAEYRAAQEIARIERLMRHEAFAAAYPDWQAWAAGYARDESLAHDCAYVARDLPGARDGVYAVYARGNEVITSGGAHAPLKAAVMAWRKAEWCADNSREWRRNGERLKAGFYEIDHISADGTIRAGCHLIPLHAMRTLADHLSLTRGAPAPNSAAA